MKYYEIGRGGEGRVITTGIAGGLTTSPKRACH